MRRSRQSKRAAVIAAAAAIAVAFVPSAQAAGLTSVQLPGFQHTVSCLSASLCVIAGSTSHNAGDLVALRSGAAVHTSTVPRTQELYDVSCAGASGCVAVARPSNDLGAVFVPVNRSGVAQRPIRVKTAPGEFITQIACITTRNCLVAGSRDATEIEVGTWNGRSLSLHRLAPPPGTKSSDVNIACAGSSCELVGTAFTSANAAVGFVEKLSHGRPGGMHTAPGYLLQGVSCVSASSCFATASLSSNTEATAYVVPVTGGVLGTPVRTAAQVLGAIACTGATCVAVGKAAPAEGASAAYSGAIVTLTSGAVTSTQTVAGSFGFESVAPAAGGFITAGLFNGTSGSLIVSG